MRLFCRDLPELNSFGNDREHALKEALYAIETTPRRRAFPKPKLRPWLVKTITITAILAVIGAIIGVDVLRRHTGEGADQLSNPAFYTMPSPLPAGAPGALIRSEQIAGAPSGTTSWRVIYHSRWCSRMTAS